MSGARYGYTRYSIKTTWDSLSVDDRAFVHFVSDTVPSVSSVWSRQLERDTLLIYITEFDAPSGQRVRRLMITGYIYAVLIYTDLCACCRSVCMMH